MKRLTKLLILALACMTTLGGRAQDDAEFRMEIGGGLGLSHYLGDLNTALYRQNGVAVGGTWRYLFDHYQAFKAQLTYGKIQGDASLTDDYLPPTPDQTGANTERLRYSFSSHVVDLNALYELNFWPYGYYGGYMGHKRLTPFIQLGFGFTYAGMDKKMAVNFPVGAGVKYRLGKRVNLALDWQMHFSTSDGLDGLADPHGIAGSGFKNKDCYQTTMLTLTYSFAPVCPTCNKDQ